MLVELAGRRLCLEVEEAESVLYERGLAGAARRRRCPGRPRSPAPTTGCVPLLDLAALGARITETSAA